MSTVAVRTGSANFDFLKLDWDLKGYYDRAKFVEDFFVNGDFESTIEQGEKFLRESFPNVYRSYERLQKSGESVEIQALNLLKILFKALVDVAVKAGRSVNIEFQNPVADELFATSSRKLIYIQTADNKSGKWTVYDGSEKIGDASAELQDNPLALLPNSEYLRRQADKRIKEYMHTSGVPYVLDWAELAYRENNKQAPWFRDHDVHRVLERSGFKKNADVDGNEWWDVTLDQAKKAIEAVKENRETIDGPVVDTTTIKFRPEQDAAVEQTKTAFKKHNRMLWNAKMRFGKTLSTYKLIREENFNKVLILTHRPVVSDSWEEDFNKLEMKKSGYRYGSKTGRSIESFVKDKKEKFIYFASIQDLRESERVGGKYTKNDIIFDMDWDIVVFDEAHEGTQTDLAQNVEKAVVKDSTKVLELSGTPFNLLDKFTDEQVFTWDYVMEQEAKLKWEVENPDKPNPYETLPKVNMFTFEMGNKDRYADESKAFNFKEFFRVDDEGKFVHEADVNGFLNQITTKNDTNYPYSTEQFREELRHTLWLLPGVVEAKALKALMDKHPIFGAEYTVINVVDNNNDEEASQADLDKVRSAITSEPWNTKTITLTVRKLTTGVNVKEWTAVMFLNNTTSSMNYLQAAFRAQTPYSNEIQGQKTNSYIFDFAPDRALTVMAESASINSGVGKRNTPEQKQKMAEMLNFLPIISMNGNKMKPFSVGEMLTQLKKVYAEKAVRSGFDDDSLYNDQLLTIDEDAADLFKRLQGIVGKTGATKKTNTVEISDNGLTDQELEDLEKAKKKKKKELTPEELALREKLKEAKRQRKNAISILRGISIRIPLMIFGMPVDPSQEVDIDTFIHEVDDVSWREFMPQGVTKAMFKEQAKYYDQEVFIEAGRIIRARAKSFDSLPYLDRVEEIATLHSTFKNPDKETVLTPWRVVNMQMSLTFGGLTFWNSDFTANHDEKGYPIRRWVEHKETQRIYSPDAQILEINSKTGLYPLFMAASLFQKRYEEINDGKVMAPVENAIIQRILSNNLFVIAKTPMAKTITQRTLVGYKDWQTNIVYVDDLVELLKADPVKGVKTIQETFGIMKFDAVVGNPPYDETRPGTTRQDTIYHLFYDLAEQLTDDYSLISPARFLFNGGLTPKPWNQKMLTDNHLVVRYYTQKSDAVFPNTTIKGGVAILQRSVSEDFGAIKRFIPNEILRKIAHKFDSDNQESLSSIIYGGRSDLKFNDVFLADYPQSIDDRLKAVQAKNEDVTELSPNEEYELKSSSFDILPYAFKDADPNDDQKFYKILGLVNTNRIYRWIEKKYMDPRYPDNNNVDYWKVYVPESNGAGVLGETLSGPLVGSPSESSTTTFISIGKFDTEIEAENALKYVKTKFVRTLLGVLKITQHNPKSTWAYVPLQNFTNESDIDWSATLADIDNQLFAKYHFDSEEINFIKDNVQPMI
ncbi:Eco57I restriction-modification methylase domain-containing protein [Weissella cibaria]